MRYIVIDKQRAADARNRVAQLGVDDVEIEVAQGDMTVERVNAITDSELIAQGSIFDAMNDDFACDVTRLGAIQQGRQFVERDTSVLDAACDGDETAWCRRGVLWVHWGFFWFGF